MDWININEEVPVWYTNVNIRVKHEDVIRENWHRLTGDGDTIYYGSLETDEIIFENEVTHWMLSE